jgi:hypothetical protein
MCLSELYVSSCRGVDIVLRITCALDSGSGNAMVSGLSDCSLEGNVATGIIVIYPASFRSRSRIPSLEYV